MMIFIKNSKFQRQVLCRHLKKKKNELLLFNLCYSHKNNRKAIKLHMYLICLYIYLFKFLGFESSNKIILATD